MKRIILSSLGLALGLMMIVVSCSKSGGGYGSSSSNPPATPAANTVSIVNMTTYAPASITVTAGTTITWTNNDNMAHTVTADDNSFNSGNIAAGGTYSKQFSVAGTYPYHCTIHSGMKATVVVK